MNKRFISILLSLCMIFSVVAPSIYAENTGFYLDPTPVYNDVMGDISGPMHLPVDTLEGYGDRADRQIPPTGGFVKDANKPATPTAGLTEPSPYASTLEKARQEAANAADKVTFIVELEKLSLLDRGFDKDEISAQTSAVERYQEEQLMALEVLEDSLTQSFGRDSEFEVGFKYTVALTGLSVKTELGNKAIIEAMPGVKSVFVAPVYDLPTPVSTSTEEPLVPLTHNAVKMIGADQLNRNGYTGKGMRIAILDTGMLLNHPNFDPLPADKLENPLTREEIDSVWKKLNASKTTLLPNAYWNTKIPYRFNYSALNYNVDHSYAKHDHGTHVAGIAAANKIPESTAVGVAPDAQILVMQVFGPQGGASFEHILAALEDCIHLDVDTANLSLGSANGFTDDNEDSKTNQVFNKFKDTGIQVLVASGNDTHNARGNNTGANMSPLGNPDIGLAGTPSTYKGALAVASIDNDFKESLYFTVDGRDIGYEDTGDLDHIKFIKKFQGRTLDYVIVPGYGAESDYANINVDGKVAVVLRGKLSFADKQMNAARAGAIACIVRNNEPGEIRMHINKSKDAIPCIGILQEDGEYMAQKADGTLKVTDGKLLTFKKPQSVSSFSSWGVTPDLKLKPEIAGVGGQVYSTTDPQISGSKYATWDGTSMATPQVAGAAALVKQYFEKNHPEFKDAELRRIVANTMMSTTTIMKQEGLDVSPRAQGSGLVDIVRSTTTNGYLTSRDVTEQRPKGEMGDDPARSGRFTVNFEINNISSTKTLQYDLSATVNTERIERDVLIANKPYALNPKVQFYTGSSGEVYKFDFNEDGKLTTNDARTLLRHMKGVTALPEHLEKYADVNGDGQVTRRDVEIMLSYFADLSVSVNMTEKVRLENLPVERVSVAPNSKLQLSAEIILSDADKAYLAKFPNGIFVEGFLYAKSENDVHLNMPFVGFYGDWSEAPIFDEPKMEDATLWGIQMFTAANTLIGSNPYFLEGKGGDQYSAISYSTPLAALLFGQLRAAKKLETFVTNKETGEEYFRIDGTHMRKSMFVPQAGQVIPTIIENGRDGSKNIWDGLDKNGRQLPSGTKVTYHMVGYVDDGDDIADDRYSMDLTIDSVYPTLNNKDRLQDSLRFENARTFLKLNMTDNQHIAAVLFLAKNGKMMGKYEVDNTPGQPIEVEYDISGFGNEFSIILADYAMNQTEVDVVLDLGEHNNDVPTPLEMDKNRLYGCETFDRAAVEAGWFSAKKSDFTDYRNETFDSSNRYYAAEFVNGYIIGLSAVTGNIELITPGGTYWSTQTLVEQRGKVGENGFKVFYDMAMNYAETSTTNDEDVLYAVGWAYRGDQDNNGKDDGHNALFKLELYPNGYNAIEEVGKITGVEGEILTLGITTEGKAYGINTKGKLFSINLEPNGQGQIECTEIGETDFVNVFNYSGVNVIQSMGYDHNTGTMYWYAHSQTAVDDRYVNVNMTYKVDLETAKCEEVGTYGPGGLTALFVPHDKKSDLFTMGVPPTNVSIRPNKMIMVEGQKVKLNTEWSPWNAKPTPVRWESTDSNLATVDEYGFVTAKQKGKVQIKATAQIKNWNNEMEDKIGICEVEIVPSEDKLYSFVVQDQRINAPYLKWITFSDKDPRNITELEQQKITTLDRDGNLIEVPPMWQGGAYYNGYMYSVVRDVLQGNNSIAQGMSLYRYRVNPGANREDLTFGAPEKVGFVEGTELVNLAFDYTSSRMYAVDVKRGGLGLLDIETGDYDYLGDFSGDIGGSAIATAMTITRDGTIIIADMKSRLYTVDPDTMRTTKIYDENKEYWYYGSMTYDYNTDSIYWNPCMGPNASPFKLVRLGSDQWEPNKLSANVMEIPAMMSKAGTQSTILFAVPENELEARVIPVEDIRITSGREVKGLSGGKFQLETETTPLRPSIRTRKWSSSNSDVVEVDKFGVMTFKNPGRAEVTVSITNRDEQVDGGPFTDTVDVEVFQASGEMEAFLANDVGGSQYYNFWLTMNDYDIAHAEVKESTISIYGLLTGVFYDGYYYGYDSAKRLLRIDGDDKKSYRVIGRVRNAANPSSDVITGMTMDYAKGICYAVTQDGYFGKLNLNNAEFETVGRMDEKVFSIAVDKRGDIYGVGSSDYYQNAKLFTIDKDSAVLMVVGDMPFKAFSGKESHGTLQYNPQMTYDFKNDRLYINATSHIQEAAEITSYDGMYMINLEDSSKEPIRIGGVQLQLRGEPKKGEAFLGLMAFKDNGSPQNNDTVDGIFMNKEFGRVAVGEEVMLKASLRPSYVTNTTIRWTSSDDNIATVSDNGTVTGVQEGEVTITATSDADPTKSTTAKIRVISAQTKKIAYSAVIEKDGIFRYNIELPAKAPEKIGTMEGKVSGMVMVNGTIYYLKTENFNNYLYAYDITTNTSNLVATLSAFFELQGLGYDKDNDLLYGFGGFYIFQYQMDKVQSAGGTDVPHSSYVMDPDYGTITAISVKDGNVYYTSNSYEVVPRPQLKKTNKYFEAPELLKADLGISMAAGRCEMAYDASTGKFYITDLTDNLYYLDETGELEPIDTVGDNWSISGIALED